VLYATVQGKGPTIVLIAGLTGSTRYWQPLVRYLHGYRVIRVDLLGFGKSPQGKTYSLDEHLTSLRATLQQLHVQRPLLVAHSFGAIIAAQYARKFGDVRGLVLLGAPIFSNPATAKQRVREFAPAMAFLTFHPLFGRPSCYLHNHFPRFSRWLARRIVHLPRYVADDCLLHTWNAYSNTMDILLHYPLARVLRRNSTTTFIHGANDRITPLATVERLVKSLGAHLVRTDDTHHSYVHGNSAATAAVINAQARI
jgi:pimeloyl-ACP methyl ester carboxylesterase